jgi:hypothetical protein
VRHAADVAGGIAQLVNPAHDLLDRANLLLDEPQGVRCGREPGLRRRRQEINQSGEHSENRDQENGGADAARNAPAVQGFDRPRENERQQQRQRDGDESNVREIEQQSDRACHQHFH